MRKLEFMRVRLGHATGCGSVAAHTLRDDFMASAAAEYGVNLFTGLEARFAVGHRALEGYSTVQLCRLRRHYVQKIEELDLTAMRLYEAESGISLVASEEFDGPSGDDLGFDMDYVQLDLELDSKHPLDDPADAGESSLLLEFMKQESGLLNDLHHRVSVIDKHLFARASANMYYSAKLAKAGSPATRFINRSSADYHLHHRFRSAAELDRIGQLLRLPSVLVTPERYHCSRLEALEAMTFQLAEPVSLIKIGNYMGWRKVKTSCVIRYVVRLIAKTYRGPSCDVVHKNGIAEAYCAAIDRKCGIQRGKSLSFAGFIDGTPVRTNRPDTQRVPRLLLPQFQVPTAQLEARAAARKRKRGGKKKAQHRCRCVNPAERVAYSGHYKFHCLKFQAVVAPDGLIMDLSNPYCGSVNDTGMLRRSSLHNRWQRSVFGGFTIYGDGGYPNGDAVVKTSVAMENALTILRNQENQASAVTASTVNGSRTSVEHCFKLVKNHWKVFSSYRLNSVVRPRTRQMFKVAVILTNALTILLRGNQISAYFCLEPQLTLEELFCATAFQEL